VTIELRRGWTRLEYDTKSPKARYIWLTTFTKDGKPEADGDRAAGPMVDRFGLVMDPKKDAGKVV